MSSQKGEQKSVSRHEIVSKAAARFRKEGLAAVGVRPIMADAGLTHGAFYAHFPSRSKLIAAAVDHALSETLALLRAVGDSADAEHRLDAIIAAYLRPEHRNCPELGCAASALAPELARESEEFRTHFVEGLDGIVGLIADNLPPGGTVNEREWRANVIFALMLGSLQMMRIATTPARIEMHMSAGREVALALAQRPWASGA